MPSSQTRSPPGKLVESVVTVSSAGSGPKPSPAHSGGGKASKPAVAFWSPSIATVQPEAPLHAPLQPEKREPAAGDWASITEVPESKSATQVAGQSTPGGVEVTRPEPVPAITTERWKRGFGGGGGGGACSKWT